MLKSPGLLKFRDQPDEGIDLEYFFLYETQFVNQKTGELEPGGVTVLTDKDKKCYSFTGSFLWDDIYDLVKNVGFGPYPEHFYIKVVEIESTGGRPMHRLLPV